MPLIEMRDHHPKAYLRERAAAVLKVGDGETIQRVAQAGLLRSGEWETVAGWVKSYARQGLASLCVQKGRGRKPAFPAQYQAAMRDDLAEVLAASPRAHGLSHSRWRGLSECGVAGAAPARFSLSTRLVASSQSG